MVVTSESSGNEHMGQGSGSRLRFFCRGSVERCVFLRFGRIAGSLSAVPRALRPASCFHFLPELYVELASVLNQ